jgi:anti-anti-sigma factor
MSQCKVLQADCSGVYILKLVGEVRLNACSTIDSVIEKISENPNFRSLVVDLSETDYLDSTTLGMLAKLAVKAKEKSHFLPSIVSTNPDVTRIVESMGFDSVFVITKEPIESEADLAELEQTPLQEDEMRQTVLNAHKVLMDINENNHDKFRDLVDALQGSDVVATKAS